MGANDGYRVSRVHRNGVCELNLGLVVFCKTKNAQKQSLQAGSSSIAHAYLHSGSVAHPSRNRHRCNL